MSGLFFFLLISPFLFETKTLIRHWGTIDAAGTEINCSSLHQNPPPIYKICIGRFTHLSMPLSINFSRSFLK